MRDPRPWSEEGATELEQSLLRAGRADGPRKGADTRILAAIQAAPPPPVPTATFPYWAKIGAIALVAGGGALVSYQAMRSTTPAPAPAPSLVLVTDVSPAASVEADVAIEAALPPSEPIALPAPPTKNKITAKVREAIRRSPDAPAEYSLGDETKALDRTRVALDEGRPDVALRLLEEYQRMFPQGRLRPEATVLRLTALIRSGKHTAADTLAQKLLSDATYQPYNARIHSLLREAKR